MADAKWLHLFFNLVNSLVKQLEATCDPTGKQLCFKGSIQDSQSEILKLVNRLCTSDTTNSLRAVDASFPQATFDTVFQEFLQGVFASLKNYIKIECADQTNDDIVISVMRDSFENSDIENPEKFVELFLPLITSLIEKLERKPRKKVNLSISVFPSDQPREKAPTAEPGLQAESQATRCTAAPGQTPSDTAVTAVKATSPFGKRKRGQPNLPILRFVSRVIPPAQRAASRPILFPDLGPTECHEEQAAAIREHFAQLTDEPFTPYNTERALKKLHTESGSQTLYERVSPLLTRATTVSSLLTAISEQLTDDE